MKYFSFIIDIIIKEEVMEGGVTPVLEQGEIFDPFFFFFFFFIKIKFITSKQTITITK